MSFANKSINIFGSTGSIGIQTMELVRLFPEFFKVNIISGGANYKLLADQTLEFNPKAILIKKEFLTQLKSLLPNHKNIYPIDDLKFVLSNFSDFDLSVMSISGFEGLKYSSILIQNSQNKTIAIANKESIVCGGEIFLNEIAKNSIKLIPLDSEHNSIFQLLNDKKNPVNIEDIKKIIITASGGPFLNYNITQLEDVTLSDAIKNPNWKMGAKISVDSATLMNKALELIEAHYLFKLPVETVIHPQSIVHAIIQKHNDEEIQFISPPDMKIHIAHGLFYPHKSIYKHSQIQTSILSFQKIINHPFPFIDIAHEIIKNDNHLAILFNLAGEIAVQQFIDGKIKFLEIKSLVLKLLEKYSCYDKPSSVEEIIEIDYKIRLKSMSFLRLNIINTTIMLT
jgi:1-deoxy-D-xylulose-5-phosphate reductoisomerase